jgi:hypothetical protein
VEDRTTGQPPGGSVLGLSPSGAACQEHFQVVAHFINRLVFCMFADDVGLLPADMFDQMLQRARRFPGRSAEYASRPSAHRRPSAVFSLVPHRLRPTPRSAKRELLVPLRPWGRRG